VQGVEFVSKLEELMPAEELNFEPTPSVDWNYVAGFFDGDGHVIVKRYFHRQKKRYFRKVVVGFTQAEERKQVLIVIKDFLEKEGFHPQLRVQNYPDKRGYKKQPKWTLEIQNTVEAIKTLEVLKDRVVARKNEVVAALAFLKELGCYRARRYFTEGELEKIKQLYTEGYSTVTIAEMFGCNYQVINKRLRMMGVKIRPPNAWTDKAREKVSKSLREKYERK
jgi:hypothetical protein